MNETTPKHAPSPNGGYEKSDASAGSLTKFGLGLAAVAVVVLLLIFAMFKFLGRQQKSAQPARHPLAEAAQVPPGPRLQITPEADLENFRAKEDSLVHSYGWVMKDAGVVRIPVDSAMAIVAKRGLPVRRETGGGRTEAGGSMIEDGGGLR